MKFAKKDFKKKYKATKPKAKEVEVDESLYGLEGGKKHYTHNEIQTDTQEIPGDKSSDFKSDIPLDGDKFATNSKNKGANMARGGNMGVRHGVNNESVEGMDEASREKMKQMVQELLKQRTVQDDFAPTTQDTDIIQNDNLDIKQIKDLALRTKTSELIKAMEIAKEDDIQIILNILNSKVNV